MSQQRRLRDAVSAAGQDTLDLAVDEMRRIADAAERAGDPAAAAMWRAILGVLLKSVPAGLSGDHPS